MTDPRSVVRIFPDYADSVMWFADDPVPYDDSGISRSLAADMRAWEQEYYDGLTPEFRWISVEAEVRHAREGVRLARALAAELGESL